MKIAIVSQYYPPESVPIPHALAHGLAERGHHVRVVTAFPNYPDGRLAAGYKQSLRHLERDGDVQVRRVPVFVSHSRNPIGRLLNYSSFAVSSLLAHRFVRQADVVYVYATQMTAAVAPTLWMRCHKTPFVLHVQDLWPESITGSSMVSSGMANRLIAAVLKPWLRRVYRQAAATIGISTSMSRMLTERGVPEERIHTVYNWGVENGVRQPAERALAGRGLSVVYAGNLGEMQDLKTVIRAAAQVNDLEGLTIVLVGAGVLEAELRQLVHDLKASNVEFRGRVSQDEMATVYATSDFQIIPLKDLDIFRGTIPSKFQGSLSNGVPVITTIAGDVSDLVVAHDIGIVSAPEDPAALAEAFRKAHAMTPQSRLSMGSRARAFYSAEMSKSCGIDTIEEILADAAGLPIRK
jgi:glycosyltransferase involved in cell wall biosynthesis